MSLRNEPSHLDSLLS